MKRVLVLNHFAVPAGEPGGTRHTELFGALTDWDHVIVAARTNPSTRKRQADGPGFRFVPVLPYRSNGLARVANWVSYAVSATGASLAIARRRPDVVYASSPHLLAGVSGAVVATLFRKPLILEVRDMWPQVLVDMGQLDEGSAVHRVLSALETMLYARATRTVVLANGVAQALRQKGVEPDRIAFIPNAADPESFDVDEPREAARAAYGFDRATFVYAGAHGPANGLDLLLDAAATLEPDLAEVVLIGDGVSKPALQQRARALGAPVRFLDPVPKTEMPRVLHAADVGVHCLADVPLFRYGVSPNKVFDYMAAGKPVLTNTPGEITQLVHDAHSGVSVQPQDLADGLRQMLTADDEQRMSWGSAGRQYMAQHRSRRAMAARLQQLLDDVGGESDE